MLVRGLVKSGGIGGRHYSMTKKPKENEQVSSEKSWKKKVSSVTWRC